MGKLRTVTLLTVAVVLLGGPLARAQAATSLSITGSVGDPTGVSLNGSSSVKVVGHYAYVAGYNSDGLAIVDVSNRSDPTIVGYVNSAALMSHAVGVDVANGYAYVTSDLDNSLTVINVSTPSDPVIVGSVQDSVNLNGAYMVQVVGSYAYVAAQGCIGSACTGSVPHGALTIVNVSNPASPTVAGSVSNPTATYHLCSIKVVGSLAYGTAFYSNTFTVFNVSNPAAPTILGSVSNGTLLNSPADVDVVGTHAYVADQATTGGVAVLDVSNPAAPVVVGSVFSASTMNNAYALQVSDGYAFVAARDNNALTVVNVSNPTSPAVADSLTDPTLTTALALSLQNGEAYVAAYCAVKTASPCDDGLLTAVNVSAYSPPVDQTSPSTSILTGPSSLTNATSASFTFSSSEANSTFECKLDSSAWQACTSPQQYTGLANGSHTFSVQATDPAGNLDPNPPQSTWIVDTTPPSTTITSGPASDTNATSATFTFSSSKGGSTFQCTLDDGPAEPCTSPQQYTGLSDGPHTFTVAATDPAGNTDANPPQSAWTVDTTPPTTTINSMPPGLTDETYATFTFSSSKPGSTFQCTLDSGPAEPCTSPQQYAGLAPGSHTFTVAATDPAGNTDPNPPQSTWTITAPASSTPPPPSPPPSPPSPPPPTPPPPHPPAPAPRTTIASHTSGPSHAISSFTLSSSEAGSTFQCTLDGSSWRSCASAYALPSLNAGLHVFVARAINGAGTIDPTPAYVIWQSGKAPSLKLQDGDVLVLHLPAEPDALAGVLHLTIALGGNDPAVTSLFNAQPNKPTTLRVQLPAKAVRRLRARQSGSATFTLRDAAGGRSTVLYSFTLLH